MILAMLVNIFFNSMWWNVSTFEELHNCEAVFSKWPTYDITKSCLVRNPSKVLARPVDFNVTENIKFIDKVSHSSILQSVVKFWCSINGKYPYVSQKAIWKYSCCLVIIHFFLLCVIHFSMLSSECLTSLLIYFVYVFWGEEKNRNHR